jgi:hypothetical protein
MSRIVIEMSHTAPGYLGHDAGTFARPPRRRKLHNAHGGPGRRWRVTMNEILVMGLVAVAVVVVMAGLLGWLVDRDDLTV